MLYPFFPVISGMTVCIYLYPVFFFSILSHVKIFYLFFGKNALVTS